MVNVDGSYSCQRTRLKSIGLVWGLAATLQSQSAFIKWTGWTIAMALSYSDTIVNIVVVIIILVIVIIVITLYSSFSGLIC